jgi:hypothetical protein
MPGERTDKQMTPTQRNTEQIIHHLTEYLNIRFDHAGRINSVLISIKDDLVFHELANVRRSLMGDKLYGPVRQAVADVFVGDDEKRRRGLMSPTDQTSIQVELVSHCQDERVETTRGQIRIHDLKSYYASISSELASMMDLMETWIWWDILDAAELVRFEQKIGLITMIRQGRMTPEMRKRYAAVVQASDEESPNAAVTDDDILRYELKHILAIRDHWVARRQDERGYVYVLKRDELPAPNQRETIQAIADKVREYEALKDPEAFNDDVRHRYAPELHLAPDKVTQELVLAHLQKQRLGLEEEMVKVAGQERRLGPPYNYKERQLEQMDKWVQDLSAQLRGAARSPQLTPAAEAVK